MKKTLVLNCISFLFINLCFSQTNAKWRNFLYSEPKSLTKQGSKLWMSSRGGLLSFDLRTEAQRIYTPTNSGIKGSYVLSVLPENDSTIWFSTEGVVGLQKFDGKTNFQYFPQKDSTERLGHIKNIQRDLRGRLWAAGLASYAGLGSVELLKFNGNKWESYMRDSVSWGNLQFQVDSSDNLWILGETTLLRATNTAANIILMSYNLRTRTLNHVFNDVIPTEFKYSPRLALDKNNTICLSYSKSNANGKDSLFLVKYQNQTWTSQKIALPNALHISDFTFDSTGTAYILANNTLYSNVNNVWLTQTLSQSPVTLTTILFENPTKRWSLGYKRPNFSLYSSFYLTSWENNVFKTFDFTDTTSFRGFEASSDWLGVHPTNNQPMITNSYNKRSIFDGKAFKTINERHPTAYDGQAYWYVSSISVQDSLRFKSSQGGIQVFRSSNGNDIIDRPGRVLVDKKGNKFISQIATNPLDSILFKIDKNNRLTKIPLPQQALVRKIYHMAIDTSDAVWVATGYDILKYDTRSELWFDMLAAPLDMFDCRKVFADSAGSIWVGRRGSLFRFDNNRWVLVKPDSIAIHNEYLLELDPKFMAYSNGVRWILTFFGVARLEGQNYRFFNTENSPLPTNRILGIQADKHGNLWLSHALGLTVFNENGLKNVGLVPNKEIFDIQKRFSKISPNPLNTNGLLEFDNLNAATLTVQIFDAQGRLWWSTKTNKNSVQIEHSTLPSGFYIYTIDDGKRLTSGKFVVD